MKILGFQKLTLLDFPGKCAATVFTGGCNFRCPFCHNALLVTEINENDVVDESVVLSHLEKKAGLLDGLAITGGEPLLWPDIGEFIRKVRALGLKIKLDTNGSFPDRLEELLKAGLLDYVAMDIKNRPEKYALTAGVKDLDLAPVEKSIGILGTCGVDFEFRTTVVKEFHTPEDIEAAAKWIAGDEKYFLQNFVDSGELIGSDMHAVSRETLEEMKERARKYVKNTELRGV